MSAINIFISSSFHDSFTLGFNGERDALKAEIFKDKDLNDISLDYGDPQHRGSIDTSLDRVADSDLIILFIGSRYGGIVEGEDISLTHMEYRKAIELGKPLLVYVFPRDIEYPDYDYICSFIEEVEKDNKTIYADIERLFPKFKYDVLACKAGGREENEQIREKQDLYYDALASKIINDIVKIKNNIKLRLPFGVNELYDDENEELKYKQYLSNNTLRYVSRSQFKNEYKLSDDFQSENDLYKKLFEYDAEYDGILISGEGGVGKTRLMFELGRKAQKDGWTTYQIFTDFEGWDSLKLDKGKKYCFLFDYVEESTYFDTAVFNILKREYPDITIKLVANARNTYFINNDMNSSYLYRVNLSEDKTNEKLYLKYVIEKIFQQKDIDINKFDIGIEEIVNKPSFAIFLLQSILKNDNIDFHGIKGFNDYIEKRLSLTFESKAFVNIEEDVFRLLFSLPIKEKMVRERINGSILDVLEHDGWLEYHEESNLFHSSYNDTIVDELLISYLKKEDFSLDRKLKKEVSNILKFGNNSSSVDNILWSMERIFYKSVLSKKVSLLQNDMQKICSELVFLGPRSIRKMIKLFDLDEKNIAIQRLSRGITFYGQGWAIKTLGRNTEEVKVFAKKYLEQDIEDCYPSTAVSCIEVLGKESEEVKVVAKKYLEQDINNYHAEMLIKCIYILGKGAEEVKRFAERYLELDTRKVNSFIAIQCMKISGKGSVRAKRFAEKYLELETRELDLALTTQCLIVLEKASEEAKRFTERYLELDTREVNSSIAIQCMKILGEDSEEVKRFVERYLKLDTRELNSIIAIQCMKISGKGAEEVKRFAERYLELEVREFDFALARQCLIVLEKASEEAKRFTERFSERYLELDTREVNSSIAIQCMKILGEDSEKVKRFSERYLEFKTREFDFFLATQCLIVLEKGSEEEKMFTVKFAKKYLIEDIGKLNYNLFKKCLKIVGEDSEEVKRFVERYLKLDTRELNSIIAIQCMKISGKGAEEVKRFAERYLELEVREFDFALATQCLIVLEKGSEEAKRFAGKFAERYLKLDTREVNSIIAIQCMKISGKGSVGAKRFAEKYLELETRELDLALTTQCLKELDEGSEEVKRFTERFAERYLELDTREVNSSIAIQCMKILGEDSEKAKRFAVRYLELETREFDFALARQCLIVLKKGSEEAKRFAKGYLKTDNKFFDYDIVVSCIEILNMNSKDVIIFVKKCHEDTNQKLDSRIADICSEILEKTSKKVITLAKKVPGNTQKEKGKRVSAKNPFR